MNVNKIKSKISGNTGRITMIMMLAVAMVAGAAVPSMAQTQEETTQAAEIVNDNDDILAGDTGTFSAQLGDSLNESDVDTYEWSMEDADGNAVTLDSASGSEINHTFDSAGEYNISLTVTDTSGGSYGDTYTVNVGEVYTLDATAVLDGENVTADFTLDGENKSGESVQYEVGDGEQTITAEYIAENDDGENVTYTASKTVDMNSSDQSVELTLTEEKDVVGDVVDTAGSTWTDLVTEYGVVIAGIIVFVLVLIIYYGGKAIVGALRDDPQP